MPSQLRCRVLFGSKPGVGLWFVLLGKELYVQSSGQESAEELQVNLASPASFPIAIDDPDGTRYTVVSATVCGDKPLKLGLVVDITGSVQYRQFGITPLAENYTCAPIAHFHGALAAEIRTPSRHSLEFVRGRPQQVQALITTSGAAKDTFVAVCCEIGGGISVFPDGVCPIVTIQYRDEGIIRGVEALVYPLDKVC
jgi:hypothetical protein